MVAVAASALAVVAVVLAPELAVTVGTIMPMVAVVVAVAATLHWVVPVGYRAAVAAVVVTLAAVRELADLLQSASAIRALPIMIG
jgi:hypothetical protein